MKEFISINHASFCDAKFLCKEPNLNTLENWKMAVNSNRDANKQVRRLQRLQSSKLLPVGYGFRPTDHELINFYLCRKNEGSLPGIYGVLVPEVDVFSCPPWELPDKSLFQSGDPVWHFFSRKNRNYPDGRCDTTDGHWVITPKERDIVVPPRSLLIGKKRTIIFYQKPHAEREVRDIWAIHEYHTLNDQDDFVLCRLLKKPVEMFQNDNYRHNNMASSNSIHGVNGAEVNEQLGGEVPSVREHLFPCA